MLSILFMNVFSDPLAPVLTLKTEQGTLVAELPLFYGTPGIPSKIKAVAVTRNKGKMAARVEKANSYFEALKDMARFDPKVPATSVGQFQVSGFTKTDTGLALMKFWKNVDGGVKRTVYSLALDLASVGKKADEEITEDQVQASWLERFWTLVSGKKTTFSEKEVKPYVPPATRAAIDAFVAEGTNSGKVFAGLKGLVPRSYDGLTAEEKKEAKKLEMDRIVYPLLSLQKAGIDTAITFGGKVKELLNPDIETAIAGTTDLFNSDDKPSNLQLAFWRVWMKLIIKMKASSPDQTQTEQLLGTSLDELNSIKDIYINDDRDDKTTPLKAQEADEAFGRKVSSRL